MTDHEPSPSADPSPIRPASDDNPWRNPYAFDVRKAPVTTILTVANVVVFLIAELQGSTLDTQTLLRFGASERYLIWSGEYWRFVTPMFLHIGVIHLVWNCYAMLGWCNPVEQTLGSVRFLVAYLLSGIGATAVSLLCHDVVAAGASGAGFGIIGVTLAIFYDWLGSWRAFFASAYVRRILITAVIWTAIGFSVGRMDNYAHLGGLVFGYLLGLVFTAKALRSGPLRLLAPAGFGLLLAGTVVAAAYPWAGQHTQWGAYQEALAGHEDLHKQNYREAIAHLDRAQALGYSGPDLFFNRAAARQSLGDHKGALSDWNRGIKRQPRDPEAYLHRGYARAAMGDLEGASTDWQKALEIAPKDWPNRQTAEQALEVTKKQRERK
jgi:rhomboid protease GluP